MSFDYILFVLYVTLIYLFARGYAMAQLHQEHRFCSISKEKVAKLLGVNPTMGLSINQVESHRAHFGANSITQEKPKAVLSLILEGIQEPMMVLLLAVAFLSLIFGKLFEAIAMIFIVVAYISVELINKYRADRIISNLKALATPLTTVLREGKEIEIKTEDVVVGDIIILSEGSQIPADARLLTSLNVLVSEAVLTGESMPIEKNADALVSANAAINEKVNCVFSGTTVLNGEGTAVVFAVGINSEFGKIAEQTQKAKREVTILQEAMTKLAKVLALFALCVSAFIPIIGYFRGLGLQDMILTWLSLTFLMIPGQPPIIITMALAVAAFALAKKQVIVRRLRGVEVAGQITALVSDKTGTITENSMVAERFYLADGINQLLPEDIQEKIVLALPDYINDPTDEAVFAKLKIKKKKLQQIGFTGFSHQNAWRDLAYKKNGFVLHAITGIPELVVSHANLSNKQKLKLIEIVKQEAKLGKRITAYAYLEDRNEKLSELTGLEFVAIAVIRDPVRSGVKEALKILEQAHIKTCIVTGDHKETAAAIASEIGIAGDVITGDQLDIMDDKEVTKNLTRSAIFARIDPLQKLRLVKILQANGEIVAALGDGVNDAPALKAAQVGIAMGKIGTDLAKEVSDLIITDDNYAHIPDAVEISRRALDNFKKGITYYLSAKTILLTIFLVPLLLALPFPFVPIQILLIEVLMDLASSTIFVTETAEHGIMQWPAENIKTFLGVPLIARILKNSIALSAGILFVYIKNYYRYTSITAQTAALVTWLLGHILLALNLKQEKVPLLVQGFFSNRFGIFWLLSMILFSLTITNVTYFYPYLKTTWLPISLWAEIVLVACLSTFWIEVKKIVGFI